MAPERADFLTAHRLPDVLAVADLLAGEHERAAPPDDALEDGRRQAVDLSAVVPENGERTQDDEGKAEPESAVAHGGMSPSGKSLPLPRAVSLLTGKPHAYARHQEVKHGDLFGPSRGGASSFIRLLAGMHQRHGWL